MSIKKTNLIKKAASGVALVALSGVVPQPLVNDAQAATATINLSGSFITGIQLTALNALNFGSIAVTSPTGTASVSTAGGFVSTDAVAVGGALAAGKITFKAVNTTPNVDITAKCTQAQKLTLAATGGGNGPTGTIKVVSVTLGAIGATATTLAFGAGTTIQKAGYNINTKSAAMLVGTNVSWAGGQPIGTFAAPLIMTISY